MGLLVAVVVMAMLASTIYFVGGPFSGAEAEDGEPTTVLGQSISAAKITAAEQQLNQVRQMVAVNKDHVDNTYPPTLESAGVRGTTGICPLSEEPYGYDPETGRVWSTHPKLQDK